MEPPATVGSGSGSGGGGGNHQQQQRQQGMGQMLTGIIRVAVFWYFASKFFGGPKRPPTESSHQISNLFHKGEPLVRLYYFYMRMIFYLVCVYLVCEYSHQRMYEYACVTVFVFLELKLAELSSWLMAFSLNHAILVFAVKV